MTRRSRRAVLRRLVTAAVAASGGCLGDMAGGGTPTPDATNPAVGEVSQMGDLRLTSPAFTDGEPIPEKYGYTNENVNPPLSIVGVPDGAASLALVVDDPDAVEPAGKVWDHWVVWNVPPETTEIPENWDPSTVGAVEGRNDYNERGYGGPNPPDRQHTYRFKLYALDAEVDLDPGATKEDLGRAMDGHVLARTQLEGTFSP